MARGIGRRTFLSRAAVAGLVGTALPSLDSCGHAETRSGEQFTPRPGDSDESVFAAARRELLIPPSVTFCNTGTLGASPREVIDAVVNAYRAVERDLPDWPYRPQPTDVPPMTGYLPIPQFRQEAGALLNAPLEEVAFTQNATMGMSFLANGFDAQRGDEILTTDQEHIGGINPWRLLARRRGAVVKELALGLVLARGPEGIIQLFADAITPRTRVVMFSHITSVLGIKLPARELCSLARDRGALAIVDGAQTVGQMPVDVKAIGCDAYVTSTHKWLLAPKGTGMLFIRREVQDRFWNTLATEKFDDDTTGAFRFMHFGTGSMPSVHGLIAATRFMTHLGIERIARWDEMLTTRLRDGLARIPRARLVSPADPRFASAMTTFAVAGHKADDVQDALWEKKIRVRAEKNAGADVGVRFSAHFYVSPADVDRALEVIAGLG